jgi:hypothetical protein
MTSQIPRDLELAARTDNNTDQKTIEHITDKHVTHESFEAHDGDVLHLRRRSSLGSITQQAPHGHSKLQQGSLAFVRTHGRVEQRLKAVYVDVR